MASPTRWTSVWVNSRSWWWTGSPGVLRFMRLQRVRHDWVTELNWTEWMHIYIYIVYNIQLYMIYNILFYIHVCTHTHIYIKFSLGKEGSPAICENVHAWTWRILFIFSLSFYKVLFGYLKKFIKTLVNPLKKHIDRLRAGLESCLHCWLALKADLKYSLSSSIKWL